jgi:hypothetical protein
MKTALVLFALTGSMVLAQPHIAWIVRHTPGLQFETIHQQLDSLGNLCVTAGTGSGNSGDILTMKIDGHGQVLWRQQFDPSGGSWDAPNALAIDQAGNICVAASTTFTAFDRDVLTVKYDPAGNPLWTKRFASSTLHDDFPAAIATDSEGAVVVAGTEAAYNDPRALVIKYDAEGNELWRQHCVPTYSFGTGVAVDEDGSVFCAAHAAFDRDDWIVVKYGPAGNELWRVRSAGSGRAADFALNRGQVYVAAYGNRGPIKLDENGQVVWQAAGPGIQQFTKLGFDQNGEIYVGGIDPGEEDAVFRVLKYDRDGQAKYESEFGGAFTWGRGFAVDRRGNSYLTTGVFDTSGFREDAVVKLNPKGRREWQWSFAEGMPGFGFASIIRVSVDQKGGVFVSGSGATVKLVERGQNR